jgi:ribonuclease HI
MSMAKHKSKIKPEIVCHCDGFCAPNPGGIATYGFVAHTIGGELWVADGRGEVGVGTGMTTNRAEYEAILRGLEALAEQGLSCKPVLICSASQAFDVIF